MESTTIQDDDVVTTIGQLTAAHKAPHEISAEAIIISATAMPVHSNRTFTTVRK